MRNGRYGMIFHENTGLYQNTRRYVLDKLQKHPARFVVALNTLDKF